MDLKEEQYLGKSLKKKEMSVDAERDAIQAQYQRQGFAMKSKVCCQSIPCDHLAINGSKTQHRKQEGALFSFKQ